MIKTIFHSTVTGEDYNEIGKAIEAEFQTAAPEGKVVKEEKTETLEQAIEKDEFLKKTITSDGQLTPEFDKDIDELIDAFGDIGKAEEEYGENSLAVIFAKAVAYQKGDEFIEKYGREALEIVTAAIGFTAIIKAGIEQ